MGLFLLVLGYQCFCFLVGHIIDCLENQEMVNGLRNVSIERIREEFVKMFKHDSLQSINMLNRFPLVRDLVFGEMKLKLIPSLKE